MKYRNGVVHARALTKKNNRNCYVKFIHIDKKKN